MAYPAGVVTTQLTFGTAQAMIGQDALAMTVKVTPTTNLVYGGNVFIADTKTVQVAAGGSGAVTLINPDQAGFFNGGGLAIRNWGYTFEITYSNGSAALYTAPPKIITWFASDAGPLDVDTMVPIADGSGILVPASSVASAIGQLASTTDAAVSGLLTSGTATRNALDARYATSAFTTYASREALVASIGTAPALGTSIGSAGKDVYFEAYWTAGPAVRMRYTVVSTDPTATDPTAIALGSGKWLTQVFGGRKASIYQFGVYCDGGAHDDLPGTQAAVNWAVVNSAYGVGARTVTIPANDYYHSAPIVFGSAGNPTTRVAFIGEGGLGSVQFIQTSANSPQWAIAGNLVWGNTWRNISYTWATSTNPSNTGRVGFKIGGSGDFFNNVIDSTQFKNGHYFLGTSGMLWWGNHCSNLSIDGTVTGGLYSLTGASGQPNDSFENVYISAGNMVGPIMLGVALDVEYRSFEINSVALGAQLLVDQGGGSHVFTTIRVESFTYASTVTLIDVTNGKLVAEKMYLTNGDIGANAIVTLITGGSNKGGAVDVGIIEVSPNNFGSGSFVDVFGGPGGQTVRSRLNVNRIGDIRTNLAFNTQLRLTNVAGGQAADSVYVDGWDNVSRTEFWGDGDAAVSCLAPRVNVFATALAADRTVTLPSSQGGNDLCNWTGRRFEFYKPVTGSGALIVKDGSTEVARLPAGNKGSIVVSWSRAPSRAWSVVSVQAS